MNDLYEDMRVLNALYEELCWDWEDDLQFSIEGDRIVITNKGLQRDKLTKQYYYENLQSPNRTGTRQVDYIEKVYEFV